MANGELTRKQRAFVIEYLKCWNASEAARRAGYRNKANVQGARLIANDSIKAEIEKHLSEKAMGADEVLARLAEHAKGDLSCFINENGYADLSSDEARAKFYLLKKVKVKQHKEGRGEDAIVVDEIEVELHDPQAALVHIGRHLKLFTDQVEHSGGINLDHIDVILHDGGKSSDSNRSTDLQ